MRHYLRLSLHPPCICKASLCYQNQNLENSPRRQLLDLYIFEDQHEAAKSRRVDLAWKASCLITFIDRHRKVAYLQRYEDHVHDMER